MYRGKEYHNYQRQVTLVNPPLFLSRPLEIVNLTTLQRAVTKNSKK